jgi:hypothetical protein
VHGWCSTRTAAAGGDRPCHSTARMSQRFIGD